MKLKHLLLLAAALSFSACLSGGDDDDGQKYSDEWPAIFEEEYMPACMEEGLTEEQCSCGYKGLQKEYTYNEFMVESETLSEDDVPPKVEEIIFNCFSDVNHYD